MSETDILQRLKQISRISEVYHVTEYQGYREDHQGRHQEVTIRILDAGPETEVARYHVYAQSTDGRGATGNPAHSIDLALALVHWGDLDRDR